MAQIITALDHEQTDRWNLETGNCGVHFFGNALQVWCIAQGRPCSVKEAALAFNTTQEIIAEAVENGYWMAIVDGMIEHDGE